MPRRVVPSMPDDEGWSYLFAPARFAERVSKRHPGWESNLVVAGAVVYVLGDRRVACPRGSVLWIPPGLDHCPVEVTEDCRLWVAMFGDRMVATAGHASGHGFDRLDAAIARQVPEPATQLLLGAHRVANSAGRDRSMRRSALRALLLLTWKALGQGRDLTEGGAMHPAVAAAARLLDAETGRLPLPELAARCGLSACRLSRLFRRQMGVPMATFRNSCRLRRYQALRDRHPERTQLSLALDAGFASYMAFFRAFTAAYGRAPAHDWSH